MKRLLSIGLLALSVLAVSEPQAQAWVNSRFSVGLNWHHQSGNTSYLWGLWRNGQVPGPDAFSSGGYGYGAGAAPGYAPPQSHPFPFFGQNGQPGGGGGQPGLYQPGMQPGAQPGSTPVGLPPAFQPDPMSPQKVAQQNYLPYFNFTNPYQTVGYQSQNAYYPPSVQYHPYYQPTYRPEAPFYWYYGR